MAKQSTVCERCDGKFDGTPSGWLKHQRTVKHNSAKPMAGDGVPEGFPDAFAAGGSVKVADDESRIGKEFTVDKAEVVAATETAIDAKVKDRAKAAVQRGIGDILAGEATAAEVLADPDVAAVIAAEPEPVKPAKPAPVYPVTEYTPVVLPDFDPADLPERPATLQFNEFKPYEFPDRSAAVQEFAVENATELSEAEKDVATGKRYVRHGKLHSLKLLPKYEAQLASALNRLEAAQITRAGIELYDEQRFAAHYVNAKLYWESADEAARKEIGLSAEVGTLELTGAVPSVRFTSVTVNGPRKLLEGEEQVVEPVTVTLLNPVASCDPEISAQIAMDLALASAYAQALNRVIGL